MRRRLPPLRIASHICSSARQQAGCRPFREAARLAQPGIPTAGTILQTPGGKGSFVSDSQDPTRALDGWEFVCRSQSRPVCDLIH
jgi:hypothetical protein